MRNPVISYLHPVTGMQLPVSAPVIREGAGIAAVEAKLIFETLYENGKQSLTLAALLDTLPPRLLSGEHRAPDAGLQVEDAT